MQYQYLPDEFYAIVLDELKASVEAVLQSNENDLNGNLDDYYSIVKTNFEDFLENLKLHDEKRTTINGNKAIVFSVSGELQGMGIFYRYALVQGKSDFFQVMVWSEKAREIKLKPNMDSIIQSFRNL